LAIAKNAFPVSWRTYTRKRKPEKSESPAGPGSTGKTVAARKIASLVKAAEQPDHQDDRKRNADQPKQKSTTHLVPPTLFLASTIKRRNRENVPCI
jgi:hypothetical protein